MQRTPTKRRARTTMLRALLVAAVVAAAIPSVAPADSITSDTLSLVKDTAVSNAEIAVSLSQETATPGVGRVLIGRDDVFADSLSSGVMQRDGVPLLLVPPAGPLPQVVVQEIQRLDPVEAVLLGGPAALSEPVETALESLGLTVSRRAGATRIETAIDVARTDAAGADTAILVRAAAAPDATDASQGFADSMAVGAWAAETGWPILLTQSDQLTASTRDFLMTAGIGTVQVVGGTAAISDAVVAELQGMGLETERTAGDTRFATAIAVAEKRGAGSAASAAAVVLAEGQSADAWAGGFAAASRAALLDAPIVLSTGDLLPEPTQAYLAANQPGFAAALDGSAVLTCVTRTVSVCEAGRIELGLPPTITYATTPADTATVQLGATLQAVPTAPVPPEQITMEGDCLTAPVTVAGAAELTATLRDDLDPGQACETQLEAVFANGTVQTTTVQHVVAGGPPFVRTAFSAENVVVDPSGAVQRIDDVTGGGLHAFASAAQPGRWPTYIESSPTFAGHPAVDFEADFLQVDVDINPGVLPQLTVFTVMAVDSLAGRGKVYSHDNGGFDRTVGVDQRGGGSFGVFNGRGVTPYPTPPVGEAFLVVDVWDADAQLFNGYLNGTHAIVDLRATNGPGRRLLDIGRNPIGGGGEYLDGQIAEMRIFRGVMSDAERMAVEQELMSTYGIS